MKAGSCYFYSIQPFWDGCAKAGKEAREDGIFVSRMEWTSDKWTCVPGNGQIGVVITGPENFQAVCYGVLSKRKEISLYNMRRGIFIRFSPGKFSKIFQIPACEIKPEGVFIESILQPEKIGELKDTLRMEQPESRLLTLFRCWEEEGRLNRKAKERESLLASLVQQMIWERKGAVKIKELEKETAYSARRLQEVMVKQIGIAPKQLCRQTRFQHALREMMKMKDSSEAGCSIAGQAYELGYFDQAHCSREFKEFLGVCPGKLLSKAEQTYI